MIKILRPILFAFLASDAVKELVVDLLSAYAARTDNEVDDYAVDLIRRELGVEKKKRRNSLKIASGKPRGDAIPVRPERPGKPGSPLVPYPFGPQEKRKKGYA